MEVIDQDYLVVDQEVLPEGQTLVFGEMRLCNRVGCSLPHDVVVSVPYRPNKPTVELLGVSFTRLHCLKPFLLFFIGAKFCDVLYLAK